MGETTAVLRANSRIIYIRELTRTLDACFSKGSYHDGVSLKTFVSSDRDGTSLEWEAVKGHNKGLGQDNGCVNGLEAPGTGAGNCNLSHMLW